MCIFRNRYMSLIRTQMGEREREIHYIFSSHLRADQMCRGSFLGIHQ